jgi:branched-chain amino acid transport system substrate-binding protein
MPSEIGETTVAVRIILSVLAVLSSMACTFNENLEKVRAERAEKAKGDIVIAMVWSQPSGATLFDEGVMMAVEEINAQGGIFGRKMRMEIHSAVPEEEEQEVARTIAADPNVVAVIGHPISDTAIPVSVTYQKTGLLFISAGATSPRLTSHGFPYVFRNIPSDIETGRALAQFSVAKGFAKMIVIDDEREYGKTLANIFVENAARAGIEIRLRKSYYPWQTDFSFMIDDIKDRGGDAIFLGGELPQAAEVIKQARAMGVKIPFIGGDGLDQPVLWEVAGSAAEGTIVSAVFDPYDSDPNTKIFAKNFQARYGVVPDTWAALGYDAVCVLDEAFRRAKSTVPLVVASFLRFIEDRHSVMGRYSFTRNGDITGKSFFFKVVRNRKFEYVTNQAMRE